MEANPFCIVIRMALFLQGGETLCSQKAYSFNAFLKPFLSLWITHQTYFLVWSFKRSYHKRVETSPFINEERNNCLPSNVYQLRNKDHKIHFWHWDTFVLRQYKAS